MTNSNSSIVCEIHKKIPLKKKIIITVLFVGVFFVALIPFITDQLLVRAVAYWGAYKTVDAIREFNKALFFQPRRLDIYEQFGLFYESTGNYKEAAKIYKKSVKLNPTDHKSFCSLGRIYAIHIGDLPEACSYFKRAKELKPDINLYSSLYNRCIEKLHK